MFSNEFSKYLNVLDSSELNCETLTYSSVKSIWTSDVFDYFDARNFKSVAIMSSNSVLWDNLAVFKLWNSYEFTTKNIFKNNDNYCRLSEVPHTHIISLLHVSFISHLQWWHWMQCSFWEKYSGNSWSYTSWTWGRTLHSDLCLRLLRHFCYSLEWSRNFPQVYPLRRFEFSTFTITIFKRVITHHLAPA